MSIFRSIVPVTNSAALQGGVVPGFLPAHLAARVALHGGPVAARHGAGHVGRLRPPGRRHSLHLPLQQYLGGFGARTSFG